MRAARRVREGARGRRPVATPAPRPRAYLTTALREAKASLRGAGPSAGPMLRSQSPDLVRQELAAWAAATEMTRGVARAAALAASPAKKGRRAGMPVQAREISHARTRRAVTAAIRTGKNQLHGADQGTREIPDRHRPEPAPRPQGQMRQHLPPRRPRGHRHPDRPGRHHPRQHASLTSVNTETSPRDAARRPVEPAVIRHDTPALGMPATRNYPPSPKPGTSHQTPKCLKPMALRCW